MTTEDLGHVLVRFDGGARGAFKVSQGAAGRKNFLHFEVDGSESALAWNAERHEELWLGRRDEPNAVLQRNAALMQPSAAAHTFLRPGMPRAGSRRFGSFTGASTPRSPPARLRRARLPDLRRRAPRERPGRRDRPLQRRATMGGGTDMKLGLLTAAFPRLRLEGVATWASANGFEMLEVASWPASGGERRRYAGVSHIDVERLDAAKVRDVLDRHGLEISSLAYYPNNLHPDPGERRAVNTHLRKVVDAAAALGVPTVGTFVGRDRTKNVPDNFREFRKVWPRLVAYAGTKG